MSAFSRSTAIFSEPSVRSPLARSDPLWLCIVSLRPSSQASRTFGSLDSTTAGPVNVARTFRQHQSAVEIDLPRRYTPVEARTLAEPDLGGAAELDGAVVRSVLHLHLVEQPAARSKLHPRAGAPRFARERPAAYRSD